MGPSQNLPGIGPQAFSLYFSIYQSACHFGGNYPIFDPQPKVSQGLDPRPRLLGSFFRRDLLLLGLRAVLILVAKQRNKETKLQTKTKTHFKVALFRLSSSHGEIWGLFNPLEQTEAIRGCSFHLRLTDMASNVFPKQK